MSAAKCPTCGKPAAKEARPFCSPRCRDVDLNRWLTGSYVIPGAALEEMETPPSDPADEDS